MKITKTVIKYNSQLAHSALPRSFSITIHLPSYTPIMTTKQPLHIWILPWHIIIYYYLFCFFLWVCKCFNWYIMFTDEYCNSYGRRQKFLCSANIKVYLWIIVEAFCTHSLFNLKLCDTRYVENHASILFPIWLLIVRVAW